MEHDEKHPPVSVRPSENGLRILRAGLADPERVARLVCSGSWLASAKVLKRDARSIVLGGRLDTLDVVVKCVRLDRAQDSFSRLLGQTRGLRQWRGAALLASCGFAVADSLVLFRGSDSGGRVVESMVMERVEGPTLLKVIAEDRRGRAGVEAEAVALEAGRLVRSMCDAGLRNRDLKASNVIVRPAGGVAARLVQIDTVGVFERAGGGVKAEMLMRLAVEAIGVGAPPRRTLAWRGVRAACGVPAGRAGREVVKALWRDVERLLAAHGDPTPRVNPL